MDIGSTYLPAENGDCLHNHQNDGEEATPNFIPLLPDIHCILFFFFFACFTERLIQNAAITIKMVLNLLSRIVF